jgi:hypothetical protein
LAARAATAKKMAARRAAAAGAALAVVATLTTGPSAVSAPPTLDQLARLADGSVDFSGWTRQTSVAERTVLARDSFTRNGVPYQVELRVPAPRTAFTAMFSNVLADTQANRRHTYAYELGSGYTSNLWFAQGGNRGRITCAAPAFYTATLQDSPVAAKACAGKTPAGADVTVSDVVRVVADGGVFHDITLTNTGTAALTGFSFEAMLDTELDGDDRIPLIKSTTNALYIENTGFRLYLAMTGGDRVVVGDFTNSSTLSGWADVASFAAGDVVVTGVDSAVLYQAVNRTLAPGTSLTLTFDERLFPVPEIEPGRATVKLVDDAAGGADVTPTNPAAANLTGEPLTEIGFTLADAKALTPAGYDVVGIDNIDLYDADNSTVQEIVVHLRPGATHTYGTATVTRIIVYQGAGLDTPPTVVQQQTFDTDTNNATGVVSYSNGTGYLAVPSPAVAGFWPLTAEAPPVAPSAAPTTAAPDNATVTVTYVTDEPHPVITAQPAMEGSQVTISATGSFDPRGGQLVYAWDLDNDGVYDDGDQAEVTFTAPGAGNHPVGLQVTDSLGRTSQMTFDVVVGNVVPVVQLGGDVEVGAHGLFTLDGSFADPGVDSWTAEVSYGDGTPAETLALNGQNFTLSHRYGEPGQYTVTVQVSDLAGGSTGHATVLVTVPAPSGASSPPPGARQPQNTLPAELGATGSGGAAPVGGASLALLVAGLAALAASRLRRARMR